MNRRRTSCVLVLAFLGVFADAAFDPGRRWLGAQIDPLPPLMVYMAVTSNVAGVALLAVLGGLWADGLSANPFGISVLPLLWVGLGLHGWRDAVSHELPQTQFVLGLLAGAATPLATLGLLLTGGQHPLLGWGSLWQLTVGALAAGLGAPVCFRLLAKVNRWFAYEPVVVQSFRPDREIQRGPF